VIAPAASSPTVTVRPAWPEDQAFVGSTFAEQLERGGHKNGNRIADRVLNSDRVRVLIATDADGRIVGWLAYVPMPRVRAVVFGYVRNKLRLQGIARELARAAWPKGGAWVHGGLRGASTKGLLGQFKATEVKLEDLL